MGGMINPFANDPDRAEIWNMLVPRDIDAFLAVDWSAVAGDFVSQGFFGLHAHFKPHPDDWALDFPTLETYREEWLRQAAETRATAFAEPLREAIFRATDATAIEISGDRALLRKRFNGTIARADGTQDRLDWQTLYVLAREAGRWKIASFVGYLPR